MEVAAVETSTRSVCSRAILAAGLLALVAGCASEKDEPAPPNVVVITLDTVRADHLGCYGYDRDTTPHLNQFMAAATLYTRAYTTAPWTLPTHVSLFTGRYTHEHGVRRYKLPDGSIDRPAIPDDLPMITEGFKELGYDTAAYVTNAAFLTGRYRFNRGFDRFRSRWMYAGRLNNYIRRWLDGRGDRPFFLFVNYMDAHRPYNAEPHPAVPVDIPGPKQDRLGALIEAVLPQTGRAPEGLRQQVVDQYDTAIAHLDSALKELFGWLRERDAYDNTLILITTDHGELFGGWSLVGHGKAMYEPLLRAGLLVKFPGQQAGRVDERILSTANLPRLILDALPEAAPYRARFPRTAGSHPVVAENHFAHEETLGNSEWGSRFDRELFTIYDWPWKYTRASDGRHELFHLEEDAGEQENLVETQPEIAARLADRLRELLSENARDLSGALGAGLSAEDKEAMETLGYL